jgi:hypothetical protein
MTNYEITWSVAEVISGPGLHDNGVRDGDRRIVADGKVQKEAVSEAVLRAELVAVLENCYPRHDFGPTYDIDRIYHIEIVALEDA